MIGKKIRMDRLLPKGRVPILFLPVDHGISYGPIAGLSDIGGLFEKIRDSEIDAIILHKGLMKNPRVTSTLSNIPFLIHLSASTHLAQDPTYKIEVTTVLQALKLGASGVSVHVNLGVPREQEMLRSLGHLSEDADALGMPLLAMMYPLTKSEKDIMHAIRVAEELGADCVKIPLPDDFDAISNITNYSTIPILMAGEKVESSFDDFLTKCVSAVKNGVSGIVAGRNIFQRDRVNERIEELKNCISEVNTQNQEVKK